MIPVQVHREQTKSRLAAYAAKFDFEVGNSENPSLVRLVLCFLILSVMPVHVNEVKEGRWGKSWCYWAGREHSD